jgi:hypothetical protein
LEVIGEVPGPGNAVVPNLPWVEVIDEDEVTPPIVITTLSIVFVEVPVNRSISKDRHDTPEHEESSDVEWPESENSVKYRHPERNHASLLLLHACQ